jgi:tRNA(His) 5'-end guanylyltransferase
MPDKSLIQRGLGDLQRSLERFETYNDGFVLPDTFLVIRLDAHRYGDWSALSVGEYPCGPSMTRAFHETAVSLMASAFRTVLSYCHGDEICLFVDPSENNSPLRRSRLTSLLASAASIHFLEASGLAATFQARLSELPSLSRVIEYFFWQRRVCFRNALTISLRRALITQGYSPEEAEKQIHGLPEDQRITKLEGLGVSTSSLPETTTHGALFWWDISRTPTEEEFRLSSATSLGQNDEEFVTLVSRLVRGRSVASNTDQVPETRASKPIPTPKIPNPHERRPSKRANVSVFKV